MICYNREGMKENSWNSTKEKNIFDISKVPEDAQKNFKKIDLKNQQFREGRWTKEEHNSFVNEILRVGIKNWKKVYYIIKIFLVSWKGRLKLVIIVKYDLIFRNI